MSILDTSFTRSLNIAYPIIGGPMYPCSNPELVAAVSEAGGIGVIQPLSLVYVHGYELRSGIKKIKSLTTKPFGMNIIVEKASKLYERRMHEAIDIALDEGCRFFITSLGNARWVIDRVKPYGGITFHDVTSLRWAEKAIEQGADGLICVNNRAGGHAGVHSAREMYEELKKFHVPLVCAGGIGNEQDFVEALKIGYAAVQIGTRFIVTNECREKSEYKKAIIDASEEDIILTERVTGIPLSVIRTPYVEKIGTHISPFVRFLFKNRFTKRWIRLWYGYRAAKQFKRFSLEGNSSKEYWQAGKSVSHIHSIEPVSAIVQRFVKAALLSANL